MRRRELPTVCEQMPLSAAANSSRLASLARSQTAYNLVHRHRREVIHSPLVVTACCPRPHLSQLSAVPALLHSLSLIASLLSVSLPSDLLHLRLCASLLLSPLSTAVISDDDVLAADWLLRPILFQCRSAVGVRLRHHGLRHGRCTLRLGHRPGWCRLVAAGRPWRRDAAQFSSRPATRWDAGPATGQQTHGTRQSRARGWSAHSHSLPLLVSNCITYWRTSYVDWCAHTNSHHSVRDTLLLSDRYLVCVEVAGRTKDDLCVALEGNMLKVRQHVSHTQPV